MKRNTHLRVTGSRRSFLSGFPRTSASSSRDEQHYAPLTAAGPGKHPLLCLHIFWPLRVSKSFADVTLSHLVWANIRLLLFKGVMQTVGSLGLDTHLDGFGCEGVITFTGFAGDLPSPRPAQVLSGQPVPQPEALGEQRKLRAPTYTGPSSLSTWLCCPRAPIRVSTWMTRLQKRKTPGT